MREVYRYPLHEVFLPLCAEEAIEEPGQVTARVLHHLTTRLLDEGGRHGPLSKFTVAGYVRSINAFLSWARRDRPGSGGRGRAGGGADGLRTTDLIERDRKAYVRVRGKRDRERDVPVMPQLGRRLRRHIERGRPRGTTSDRCSWACVGAAAR